MYGREREEEKPRLVRITGTSRSQHGHSCHATVDNLSLKELEQLEQAFLGGAWVRRGDDGRLEIYQRYEPLPTPIEDPAVSPYWRKTSAVPATQQKFQFATLDETVELKLYFPSLVIGHLCGYNYTAKNYEETAAALLSYGFECFRSLRHDDGRYGEQWVLHHLPGKGALSLSVSHISDHTEKCEAAVRWLCNYLPHGFGTLDVTVQRAAMTIN